MNINLQNYFNDFNKFQQVSNTQSGDDNTAVTAEIKQSAAADLENLQPGDIFNGEIIDIRNSTVSILLNDGQQVNAVMQQAINLNIGEKINFQIKSMSNNQIVIKPYQNNEVSPDLINRSLFAAGLKMDDKNAEIVKALINHEQPIDKQTIMDTLKNVNLYGFENLDEMIEMKKHGIEVNKQYLDQYNKYIQNDYQLTESINDLQDEVLNYFEQADGISKDQVLSFLDGMDHIFSEINQEADNVWSNQSTQQNTNKTVQNNSDEIIQEHNNENQLEEKIPKVLLEESEGKVSINHDIKNQSEVENSNTIDYETNSQKLEEMLKQEKNGDLKNSSFQINKESFDQKSISDLKGIIEYLKNKDINQDGLKNLLGNDAFKGIIKKAIKDNLYIHTQKLNIGNNDEVLQNETEKVYKKLEKFISEIKNFSQDNKEASNLNNLSKEVRNNLSFMNELNHVNGFVQLPIKLTNGKQTNGELYIMRRNKKKSNAQSDTLSAFLHLDLEYLGATDVDIKMTSSNVRTTFTMQNEDSQRLIENHLDELVTALERKGYHITVEVKEKAENDDVKTAIDYITGKDEKAVSVKRYAFDIRT